MNKYYVWVGTAVQIGRSLVRFHMVSMEFFIDIILLIALWSSVPGVFSGGKNARFVRLTTLPPSWAIVK